MVGICICEQHGRAGLADVCIHIAEAVTLRSRTNNVVSIRFKMGHFANQVDAEVILVLTYCPNCAEDYGFPTANCELTDSDWEEFARGGQFTGVCAECLKEVI